MNEWTLQLRMSAVLDILSSARRHERVDLDDLEEKSQHHQILSYVRVTYTLYWDVHAITQTSHFFFSNMEDWGNYHINMYESLENMLVCNKAAQSTLLYMYIYIYSWEILFDLLSCWIWRYYFANHWYLTFYYNIGGDKIIRRTRNAT